MNKSSLQRSGRNRMEKRTLAVRGAFGIAMLALLICASPASATSFTFATIDYPDVSAQSVGTILTGINNVGNIAGLYGDGSTIHAFELSSDHRVFTSADISGSTETVSWGINNAGAVVGAAWVPQH